MKIAFVLLFGALLGARAEGMAQEITMSEKNASLEKVFRIIHAQTGFYFLYNNQEMKRAGKVTIDVHGAGLEEVLRQCFEGQPLTYTISDKTIVIRARETPAPQEQEPRESTILNGKVVDETGNPVAGATVIDKKTHKGTVTLRDGTFQIDVPVGDVIEISFVGYKPQEHRATGTEPVLRFVMVREVANLTETVVIGYGSTQKKDVTGSVSVVSSKDIEDVPFTTVDNALAGKAAGVEVTKTDGTPGGAVRIRVRGSTSLLGGNTPLYVIDGVPVEAQSNYINPGFDITSPAGNGVSGSGGDNASMSTAFVNGLNSLGGLNVDDIESITILKDASSTAIYGSKAANGVVIITTKKGRKDTKPQIVVSYYGTVTSPINPKILNASQYKMLLTEAAQNDFDYRNTTGQPIPSNVDGILNQPASFFGTANTNWLDQVTRTTYSNNLVLSVQGGGTASRYYSSISYNSTPGVVDATDYQRISGKISMENDIGSRFRFLTNFDLGYTNQDITNGAYGMALTARPDWQPYDAAGNFTDFSSEGAVYQGFQNPLAMTTALNNSKTFSLLGSLSAQYEIIHNLIFKSTVSLNMQDYNQRMYTPSYLQIGSFNGNISSGGGIGSNANGTLNDWFWENTLTYDKTFHENHTLNVLAGTSYETTKNDFFSATGQGYPNDNVLNSLSSAATPLYVRGDNPDKPQSYLLSFYARANYGYKDKYLLTFTGRADGSSKFGPDNKFGYFPSGAVAWRLSKERFLEGAHWLDDLKLRVSYGLTGNQNIGNQMYRTLYTPYTYNGSNALLPTQLGNAAIKWETTKEKDGGLDVSLFKGRLQGTFDYYDKETGDALLSLPLAASSSYPSLLQNVVSIRNRGVELALQGDLIKTRDFRWSASFNITWNKSIVTHIDPNADLTQIGDLTGGIEYNNTALIQGKPLGLITGMKVTGIIKTQKQLADYQSALGSFAGYFGYLGLGDPMFELDTVTYKAYGAAYPLFNAIIGSAAPKDYGGFTQEFAYKRFDVSLYFTFSQGGKLEWADDVNSVEFVGVSNANASMLGRWTPQNPNSNRPRLLLNDGIIYNSNLSVYNSSYLKLRTITLNYRLEKSPWMERKGFRTATIFLSATNVFTITKYPGNDPEASDDAYSVGGGYFDVSNYPPVKTFSIGLKAGF